MRPLERMRQVKMLAATTALVCGALTVSSVARADYSYTFTLTALNGNISNTTGSFTTSELITNSSVGLINYGIYNYTVNSSNISGMFTPSSSGFYPSSLINFTGNGLPSANFNSGNLFTLSGNFTVSNNNTLSATVGVRQVVNDEGVQSRYTGFGSFEALLSSSGSGSGSGSSGGAPSPEVNVALGLAMASGTVAFLRRRKKNAAKSNA